ncbi:DoxX family protein [Mycobacterium sp.]|uniref:DoxX family protein n=1 Tax=Mycobacterium sp. TaxID=1785 RepID=UPI003D6B1CD7
MTATAPIAHRDGSQVPAYWLTLMLIGTGITHFLAPKPFDTIVPAELPGNPRTYTYVSGAAEIATGTLLLVPRTRRFGALVAAALFVAVFPGNINMVRLWWNKPWPMRLVAIARLPLQIPMVAAALKVRRNT